MVVSCGNLQIHMYIGALPMQTFLMIDQIICVDRQGKSLAFSVNAVYPLCVTLCMGGVLDIVLL